MPCATGLVVYENIPLSVEAKPLHVVTAGSMSDMAILRHLRSWQISRRSLYCLAAWGPRDLKFRATGENGSIIKLEGGAARRS
jgi:hypothetical protein